MDTAQLHNLFQLSAQNNAPHFILFTTELSNRLSYTCDFIFTHVLNCKYHITNDQAVFESSDSIKLNYSRIFIDKAFRVLPHTLLFEKGINGSYKPMSSKRDEIVYFNLNTDSCDLGFDLFASVFYFISRYQEWQTFEKDTHRRFELKNSIQFETGSHLIPLVNIWINELKLKLHAHYPSLKFPAKKFQYISTIDVDNLYAYKNKGALRTIGAFGKDLLKLDLMNFTRRLKVLLNKEQDPFDVYTKLEELSKSTRIPLIFFFLQRSNTKHDRTINPHSNAFKKVFEQLKKDGVAFGLHPSYYTSSEPELMKHEFDLIRKNSNCPVSISRQHYLRFDIRATPQILINNKVVADFSMGFASGVGYRAATFTPFYYFNLEANEVSNLLMVPFAAMDGAYFVYNQTSASDAELQIEKMAEQVKSLEGIFITVFHERTFDSVLYPGFGQLYSNLHKKLG